MATPAQEQLFMQSPLRFLTGSSFEALSNKERYSMRSLGPYMTCRTENALASEQEEFRVQDM